MSLSTLSQFSGDDFFESMFYCVENSVLLMNEQGIVRYINPAFTNCFGYDEKDIVSKHFEILFTDEDRQQGRPQKELASALTRGQGSDNNYIVHLDGSKIWVSGESVLVSNGKGEHCLLKVIQNIHKQKVAEQELRVINTLNQHILSNIDDAVIVLDNKMMVSNFNASFIKIFDGHFTHNERIPFDKLIAPFDNYGELQQNMELASDKSLSFSHLPFEMTRATGDKSYFEISGMPIDDANIDHHVLMVMHDTTLQRQIHREREDVIGFVAHELRNPLANLMLCNDIMREAINLNAVNEMKDMITRSNNNIVRLNKLIGFLHQATEVNAGQMKLEITEFDFDEMIIEAIDTVKVLNPHFTIINTGKVHTKVHGDRYRLIEVVTNYLNNGIKYSDKDTEVTINTVLNGDKVTVSVEDHGFGISKDQMPNLFNRFFRAEKTKNLEGIGLGLYLCRRIVQAHHGQVWAESVDGKGSQFYFSIPVRQKTQ